MKASFTNSLQNLSNDHAIGAMLEIVHGLSHAWPAEQMLSKALVRISQACKMQAACMYLWNPIRQLLELKVFEGPEDSFFRTLKSIAPGEFYTGTVAETCQPLIRSLASHPLTRIRTVAAQEGFNTFTAVPVLFQHKLFGVITFFCTQCEQHCKNHLKFIETAAGILSLRLKHIADTAGSQKQADPYIRRTNPFTETKQDLSCSQAESKEEADILSSLIYRVSHDLKAPLRHMENYCRSIFDHHSQNLPPEVGSLLQKACGSINRMNGLVEDLLEYSRIQEKTFTVERIRLCEVVEVLVSRHQSKLDGAGITLEIRTSQTEVLADFSGLLQVLSKILDNAIKFTQSQPCPKILIHDFERHGQRVLRISDNGIGFDMRYHDRIFGVFQRLESRSLFPGNGIGLAVAKAILDKTGGEIWGNASPGKGARFFVSLPTPKN